MEVILSRYPDGEKGKQQQKSDNKLIECNITLKSTQFRGIE